ncbi:MAG TPA: sialidase family protein [Gemmatimonadaceae bacterium]|nr:sialidase family protein [Gemmatimonadaceae bacterium]
MAVATLDSLSSPAATGSSVPNLFVAADGRVLMSWIEPAPDSAQALKFSVLDSPSSVKSAWSAPRTIAQGKNFLVNWADFPSIIALPDGRLAAHWLERIPGGKYSYIVRVSQSRDGGQSWSPPVSPHRDDSPTEHGFVSLFPAAGDSLGAVWLDGRAFATAQSDSGEEMQLLQTTLAPDNSLGAERRLDSRICDCCQTSMALTARGPVVVYRDRSPDEVRDISILRLVDGNWSAPRRVHADDWRIDFCPVNGPAVSAHGDTVAVAWFTGSRDTARVQAIFSFDGGQTFGQAVRVDGGMPEGRVDVVLDNRGRALVSWVERTGGENAEVRVRRVSPGGTMSEPMSVATSSAGRASGFPRMVAAGTDLIFAWTVPGTPSVVRVARARLDYSD